MEVLLAMPLSKAFCKAWICIPKHKKKPTQIILCNANIRKHYFNHKYKPWNISNIQIEQSN